MWFHVAIFPLMNHANGVIKISCPTLDPKNFSNSFFLKHRKGRLPEKSITIFAASGIWPLTHQHDHGP